MYERYHQLNKEFNEYYETAKQAREKNDFYNLSLYLRKAGQCQIDMSECCPENERANHVFRGKDFIEKASMWEKLHPESFQNVNQNKGDSGLRIKPVEKVSTSFNDIIGCEDVKEFVRKQYIKRFDPKYQVVFNDGRGGAMERGVLLYGLPGTGKTMIARGIATELSLNEGRDVAFFAVKGSDLKDKYQGGTEKKINELYEDASKHQLAVVYIDEIETLIPSRSSNIENFEASAVTEFLRVLDGFEKEKTKNVITIGASNFPNRIDAAALRPGRLGAWFRVDVPNEKLREKLIKSNFGKSYKIEEEGIDFAVKETRRYSGADIVALCERVKSLLSDKGIDAVDRGKSEAEVLKFSSVVTKEIVKKVLDRSNGSISNRSILELQEFEMNYNVKNPNGPIAEYMKNMK